MMISFFDASRFVDGTIWNFIVSGEMVEKLPENLISKTDNEINRSKVKSFRNIIVQNYFGNDAEEVWQIIQGSLIALKAQLESLIRQPIYPDLYR